MTKRAAPDLYAAVQAHTADQQEAADLVRAERATHYGFDLADMRRLAEDAERDPSIIPGLSSLQRVALSTWQQRERNIARRTHPNGDAA